MSLYVKPQYKLLYSDCYTNLGWEIHENHAEINIPQLIRYPFYPFDFVGNGLTSLNLKRDRNIKGKVQLNLLQRQCESALAKINSFEREKETLPVTVSLTFGITGLLFIIGAVFSFIAHIIPLFVVAVILGITGCILSLFYYKRLKNSQASQVTQKMEEQYKIIDQICEQAKNLWA